jgi:HEAT repeat protein
MSMLTASLKVLQSGDFHARWDAAREIARFGELAIAPLIKLLQSPESDLEVQWLVAQTLGEFRHPEALMALATLLRTTEDDEISQVAASTLGQMGVEAIPVLADCLHRPETTLAAVQALAHIHDLQTIPLLLQVVEDERVAVRTAALEALLLFHQPQVVPCLIQALSDPSPQVRQVAVTGLGYRPALQEQVDLVALIQPLLREGLCSQGGGPASGDHDLAVSQQAALALGRLGAAEALFTGLQTLDSATDSLPTSEAAITVLPASAPIALGHTLIQALGQMETLEALLQLQQAFNLSIAVAHPEIKVAVIRAIARLSVSELQPTAARMLLEMLANPQSQSPILLQEIATGLGQLRQPEAMEPLIGLLAQPDLGVRLHAIAALKHLQIDTVYKRLQILADNSTLAPELTAGIKTALQEWSLTPYG